MLGVIKLVVVVNKMDDLSVEWAKERYDEIEKKIMLFLKQCGYKIDVDVIFVLILGLMGVNMQKKVGLDVCSWYEGKLFFDMFDDFELFFRDLNVLVRLLVMDKYNEVGVMVMGKIEFGILCMGQMFMLMLNKVGVKVVVLFCDEVECMKCLLGENVCLKLMGV